MQSGKMPGKDRATYLLLHSAQEDFVFRYSASWDIYEKYQFAATLREIIELSVTSKNPVEWSQQSATARKDITNEAERKRTGSHEEETGIIGLEGRFSGMKTPHNPAAF